MSTFSYFSHLEWKGLQPSFGRIMKESQTFLFRIKSWYHFECKGKVSSWIPSLSEDNRRLIVGKEWKTDGSRTKLSFLYSRNVLLAIVRYINFMFHLQAVRINPRTWEIYRHRCEKTTRHSFLVNSFVINQKFRERWPKSIYSLVHSSAWEFWTCNFTIYSLSAADIKIIKIQIDIVNYSL